MNGKKILYNIINITVILLTILFLVYDFTDALKTFDEKKEFCL